MQAFKAAIAMAAVTPAILAFNEQENLPEPIELGLIDEVGTAPCVFKLEDSFYDFTPIKVAYPNPKIPRAGWNAETKSIDVEYYFVFGWCQTIDEIDGQDLCKKGKQGDYFAARVDANPEPTEDSECMAYSGDNALKDIETRTWEGIPETMDRIEREDFSKLKGVQLIYKNGEKCPETGEDTKFTLNMYCDESMGMKEFDYSAGVLGNICNPYIDTVSKAACARLSVSDLWEYIGEYSEYFGIGLLGAGLMLVFFGRKLLKPAICIAGFLTTILVSCFIFYTVYFSQDSKLSDFWWFLGGGAIAGIFVGLLLCCCTRPGAMILAGWGGVTGGMILYEMFIY